MERMLRVFMALMVVTGLVACGDASSHVGAAGGGGLSGRIMLTGSSTAAPLVAEIGKRFEGLHPGVRVDVQTGGSGRGIADARSGAADIGMASRSLEKEEADLTSHRIAVDGVGLIVHKTNPVATLKVSQVIDIYTDRIKNWNDVGGPDRPITVVHKAEGRATLEVFLDHLEIENTEVKPDVIVGDNEQGVKTVAGAPGAIGYVSIGTAEADAAAGIAIRLIPLAGVAATRENVAAGTFPMSRPLMLVTKPSPAPLVQAFLEYAQSEAVHDLIEAQYFVPVVR